MLKGIKTPTILPGKRIKPQLLLWLIIISELLALGGLTWLIFHT